MPSILETGQRESIDLMSEEKSVSTVQSPPSAITDVLRRIGPGLIIAAMIVGSGELIATTKTGAEAGFSLLWLIVIGCVIKVFTQIEFGRYAINTGQTMMDGMNEVPGPRLRVNWLVWYWLIMFLFSTAQLGGIVGGVGQAMSMSMPITGDFNRLVAEQQAWDESARPIRTRLIEQDLEALESKDWDIRTAALDRLSVAVVAEIGTRPSQADEATKDDFYWSAIISVITAVFLVIGRYNLIQTFAMALVGSFTIITIGNLFALQSHAEWSVHIADVREGFAFRLPGVTLGTAITPLATALAAFGIIGMGAAELVAYPYWCLEKGYARFVGPREDSSAWSERARGWLRVMRWDAWCSMAIYTFATIAFYLLGAAVLNRQGLNPRGDQLIYVLSQMYVPVFGTWARGLFLFGAFAVLYSTFFVASASNARVIADAVRVYGLGGRTEKARLFWVRFFSGLIPIASLFVYAFVRAPVELVLASGIIQAIMLPMLAAAALYFRYRRCDERIKPGRAWDVFLWISSFGLLLAGGWAAMVKIFPQLNLLG